MASNAPNEEEVSRLDKTAAVASKWRPPTASRRPLTSSVVSFFFRFPGHVVGSSGKIASFNRLKVLYRSNQINWNRVRSIDFCRRRSLICTALKRSMPNCTVDV